VLHTVIYLGTSGLRTGEKYTATAILSMIINLEAFKSERKFFKKIYLKIEAVKLKKRFESF